MSDLFDSMSPNLNEGMEKAAVCSGMVLAKITNINDPKNKGRVKCAYISKETEVGETGWIYCLTPFGGKDYGIFFHPNVGDIVALVFENGDIHRPFVFGSLWVKDAKPPLTISSGKNEEYKIITPNKSSIDFVDQKGKESITVETPKKRTVILDDDKQLIKVSDGKNELVINGKNDSVELTCGKKLTIKVGSGVTITCDGTSGAVKIKTNKEITLSSAQINAKASGTAEISGSGSVTVKSSGMLTLKGSLTKIN